MSYKLRILSFMLLIGTGLLGSPLSVLQNDNKIQQLLSEKDTQILGAEYFIDTDPGEGSATGLTLSSGDGIYSINNNISLGILANGLHKLYVRFKDSNDKWGPARAVSFIVSDTSPAAPDINSAEYYFDTDPGMGLGNLLNVTFNNGQATLSQSDISINGLPEGRHILYIRFHSGETGWGPSRGTSFIISDKAVEPLYIAGAEYFWNTDPGKENGIAINAPQDGNYNESLEELSFTPSPPEIGVNNLFVRMKDSENRWGPVRKVQVTVIDEEESPLTLAAAEYYIDVDPGQGNGTPIPLPADGIYNETQEDLSFSPTIAGLSEGSHFVYLRMKDSNGHWGPARGTQFTISEDAQPVIAGAEYFFNADPGPGKGTALTSVDGSFDSFEESINSSIPISSTGLGVGSHKVYVRFKNSRGEWGSSVSKNFSIVIKPMIVVSETSFDFGVVFIGDSASADFYVKNDGDADLTISDITVPTGYKTNWTSAQGTVIPGDSIKVTVTFTPREEQVYSGNITLANNDVIKTISVTGSGSLTPIAKISVNPSSPYNFGDVDIFTEIEKSVDLVLTNSGTAKLWISAITSSNTNILNHTFTHLTDSLDINESIEFSIIFSPKDTIQYNEYLTISNNSPVSSYRYDITGKGIGTFAPYIVTSPDTLVFGTVQTFTTSQLPLTVQNHGTIDLIISSILPTNPDFSTNLSPSNNTIPPDSEKKLTISYRPVSTGTYEDTLSIYSNDTPNSPRRIRVFGKGSADPVPDLRVSATQLNFGNIEIGATPSTRTLSLTNVGTATLNISGISSEDPVFSTNISGSRSISQNASLDVQVSFSPVENKVYDSRLRIQNDDPDHPSLYIRLLGSSIFPEIFVLTSNLNFGDAAVTQSTDMIMTIENSGTDTLKITEFVLSDMLLDVIQITPSAFNILPKNSKNFQVKFSPVQPVEYSGTITIINNDQNQTVNVTGRGIDISAPVITFNSALIENIGTLENTSISIEADISDNNAVAWARLLYRQGGKATFDSTEMTVLGDIYSAQIPQAYVTRRGVEYYLKAFDGANVRVNPSTAPQIPAVIRIKIPSLPSITIPAETYKMISIPSDLLSKNTKTLLEEIFGEYNINNWRLFRWINGAYVELADNPNFSFDPGKAYWLITLSQEVINIDTSISVTTKENYIMSLDQGWNQVGVPYYFPVTWNDVFSASGNIIQGQTAFEYLNNEWVVASQMDPFHGYFIYTPLGGNILRIPPKESNGVLGKTGIFHEPADNEWQIRIQAESGEIRDRYNFAGTRNDASDGLDIHDIPKPPRINNEHYLSITFLTDNESGNYCGNFKSTSENGQFWDFHVEGKNLNENIVLSLIPESELPETFQIILLDKDLRTGQLWKPGIAFSPKPEKNPDKNYRLVMGFPEYISENNLNIGLTPERYHLSQNYPNPFNPVTKINYELPEPGYVTLKIYNALGQEVCSLIQREYQYPGYYDIRWSGQNDRGYTLSSGIYFYILQVNNYRAVQKMVLIK